MTNRGLYLLILSFSFSPYLFSLFVAWACASRRRSGRRATTATPATRSGRASPASPNTAAGPSSYPGAYVSLWKLRSDPSATKEVTRFAFALGSHDARNFNYWPAGKAQGFDGLREPEVWWPATRTWLWPGSSSARPPAGERVDSWLRRRRP